jgi:CyaY protein
MDRKTFNLRATAALERIDAAIAAAEPEGLDASLAGDVLTLEFRAGAPFILNAHSAAGQIWLAAGRAAWHFDWVADPEHPEQGQWIAQRTGDELIATLEQLVHERLGVRVPL